MCTVSFLPVSKSSFILTHNRDEHIARGNAIFPEKKIIYDEKILLPIDAKALGTWIATSKNYTLCLLNGGFEKHKHQPPYKHSRGQLILDFFKYKNVNFFLINSNFENIEPFTLLIIENNNIEISEIIWTGNELFFTEKNNSETHFWCSSTLYDKELQEKRKFWFQEFIKKNEFITQEKIINFHLSQPQKNEEGIQINRNGLLKTVSVTSISKNENALIEMYYEDLLSDKKIQIEL